LVRIEVMTIVWDLECSIKRMFPFFTVEVNAEQKIKVDTLKKILDIGADKLLRESFELLKTLAKFLVQYTLCICNKSDLKDKMASAQREAYQKNPEDERKNMFKCVLDFQTNIDVVFTWMHWGEGQTRASQRQPKVV
jgi:hypothetical protein